MNRAPIAIEQGQAVPIFVTGIPEKVGQEGEQKSYLKK